MIANTEADRIRLQLSAALNRAGALVGRAVKWTWALPFYLCGLAGGLVVKAWTLAIAAVKVGFQDGAQL